MTLTFVPLWIFVTKNPILVGYNVFWCHIFDKLIKIEIFKKSKKPLINTLETLNVLNCNLFNYSVIKPLVNYSGSPCL